MTTTELTAADTRASEDAIAAALRSSMRGAVIERHHHEYDQARQVWNGLIDRHPAVIARCADTADVVAAVAVAREHRPVVSIRGGGHQVAGSAVCEDGLVIDLSAMNGVHVHPAERVACVQAGATWADVDRATQLFGLATPGGEVSQTGVARLTLGGGIGSLQRAYGLSCDNLRSVEIVTADAMVRTASRTEHPDLFWALRGGGRGLGVVTSFEFDLHPLGPDVAAALVFYPYSDAAAVMRAWRDFTETAPETVSPELALWCVPADPAIPAALHGTRVVIILGVYAGPAADGGAVLAGLSELGTPLLDLAGVMPYVATQSGSDAAFPAGGRYLFKSHFLDTLTDDVLDAVLTADAGRPNPESLTVIRTLGGAIGRADDSAYPHRGARYGLSFDGAWFDPSLDGAAISWARSAWDATARFATGGVYVNFAGLDGEVARTATFGPHVARLDQVRAAYDPDDLFAAAAARP